MDEVDNIIIHSLRQIGCKIDEDIRSLSSFTPELLVATVSKCLQLIKPSLVLPKSLPSGMAQRFTVTASLAEACVAAGFQGDIGYQTFLYSNVTEVRRVYMFLIERLPKESEKLPLTQPLDKLSAFEAEIARNIAVQLSNPWIPPYCNKSCIRKYNNKILGLSAECIIFQPNLNLNIPNFNRNVTPEMREYWIKRSPSIFQQTTSKTIGPSIIHKNDIDRYYDLYSLNTDDVLKAIVSKRKECLLSVTDNNSSKSSNNNLEKSAVVEKSVINANSIIVNDNSKAAVIIKDEKINTTKSKNIAEDLDVQIDELKHSIDDCIVKRKSIQSEIVKTKELRVRIDEKLSQLRDARKVKERTCILLENPETNVTKMEAVVHSTKERMVKLQEQWQEHRKPLAEALEKSKEKNSSHNIQNREVMEQIKILREKSLDKAEDLRNKTALYTQLVNELQKVDKTINRNAYTSRILEIVGNIRKQKNDIDKVLRDTRDLQKGISNITGQLDRQFTVTDDLLFKTAKRDEHTKKAYKLLATLHSDCSDLVNLVQETGAIMREVRDLEDQIEHEKARNIATNLEKITLDLKQMEKDSKDLQEKIRKVENQITQG